MDCTYARVWEATETSHQIYQPTYTAVGKTNIIYRTKSSGLHAFHMIWKWFFLQQTLTCGVYLIACTNTETLCTTLCRMITSWHGTNDVRCGKCNLFVHTLHEHSCWMFHRSSLEVRRVYIFVVVNQLSSSETSFVLFLTSSTSLSLAWKCIMYCFSLVRQDERFLKHMKMTSDQLLGAAVWCTQMMKQTINNAHCYLLLCTYRM